MTKAAGEGEVYGPPRTDEMADAPREGVLAGYMAQVGRIAGRTLSSGSCCTGYPAGRSPRACSGGLYSLSLRPLSRPVWAAIKPPVKGKDMKCER